MKEFRSTVNIILLLFCVKSFGETVFDVPLGITPKFGSWFDYTRYLFTGETFYSDAILPSEYEEDRDPRCSSSVFLQNSTDEVFRHVNVSIEFAIFVAFDFIKASGSTSFFSDSYEHHHSMSCVIVVECKILTRKIDPHSAVIRSKVNLARQDNGHSNSKSTHMTIGLVYTKRCFLTLVDHNHDLDDKSSVTAKLGIFVNWIKSGLEAEAKGEHFSNQNSVQFSRYDRCDVTVPITAIRNADDGLQYINNVKSEMLKNTQDIGDITRVIVVERSFINDIHKTLNLNPYRKMEYSLALDLFKIDKSSDRMCTEINMYIKNVSVYQNILPQQKLNEITKFENDTCRYIETQKISIHNNMHDYLSKKVTRTEIDNYISNIKVKESLLPEIGRERAIGRKFPSIQNKMNLIQEFYYQNISYISFLNPFNVVKSSSREVLFFFMTEALQDSDRVTFDFAKSYFIIKNKSIKKYVSDCDDTDDTKEICRGLTKITIKRYVDGTEASSDVLCDLSAAAVRAYEFARSNDSLTISFLNENDESVTFPIASERKCNRLLKTRFEVTVDGNVYSNTSNIIV